MFLLIKHGSTRIKLFYSYLIFISKPFQAYNHRGNNHARNVFWQLQKCDDNGNVVKKNKELKENEKRTKKVIHWRRKNKNENQNKKVSNMEKCKDATAMIMD